MTFLEYIEDETMETEHSKNYDYVILGAGISGLSLAFFLVEGGVKPDSILLIEKEDYPGGLCRTYSNNGFLFDIGPHHFRNKLESASRLWSRFSKFKRMKPDVKLITNDGILFSFPLSIYDTYKNLGPLAFLSFASSFIISRMSISSESSLSSWVSKHYGKLFFEKFFKDYTEKITGESCDNISSEWVKNRITKPSLMRILKDPRRFNEVIPFSNNYFLYPLEGGTYAPYKNLFNYLLSKGVKFLFNSRPSSLAIERNTIGKISVDGLEIRVSNVVSTIPVDELLSLIKFSHVDDSVILDILSRIKYRNHITISVIAKRAKGNVPMSYYIHNKKDVFVRVSFMNRYTGGTGNLMPVVLEAFSGYDGLWKESDEQIFEHARSFLSDEFGMDVLQHYKVIRSEKAYPIYLKGVKQLRREINKLLHPIKNLHLLGRASLYKYLSMDTAIELSYRLSRSLLYGEEFNPDEVNEI